MSWASNTKPEAPSPARDCTRNRFKRTSPWSLRANSSTNPWRVRRSTSSRSLDASSGCSLQYSSNAPRPSSASRRSDSSSTGSCEPSSLVEGALSKSVMVEEVRGVILRRRGGPPSDGLEPCVGSTPLPRRLVYLGHAHSGKNSPREPHGHCPWTLRTLLRVYDLRR